MSNESKILQLIREMKWVYSQHNINMLCDKVRLENYILSDITPKLRERFPSQPALRDVIEYFKSMEYLHREEKVVCPYCDNRRSISVWNLHLDRAKDTSLVPFNTFWKVGISCPECTNKSAIHRKVAIAKTKRFYEISFDYTDGKFYKIDFQGTMEELLSKIERIKFSVGSNGSYKVIASHYDYLYKDFISRPDLYNLNGWGLYDPNIHDRIMSLYREECEVLTGWLEKIKGKRDSGKFPLPPMN